MTGHIRFWLWVAGLKVCDWMPTGWPIPWCNVWHGGVVFHKSIADDDPCWQRAGFSS